MQPPPGLLPAPRPSITGPTLAGNGNALPEQYTLVASLEADESGGLATLHQVSPALGPETSTAPLRLELLHAQEGLHRVRIADTSGDLDPCVLEFVLESVDGRVPVIVTVNHPSSVVASEAAAHAASSGAAAVMSLPPFFGRWRAGPAEITRHFELLDAAVEVPIVIQDTR